MASCSEWPPIPKKVDGLAGPIRVVMCPDLSEHKCPGDPEDLVLYGLWKQHTREILLKTGEQPDFIWSVFYHEMIHAALTDSGLSNMFIGNSEEQVCDALASARMREMRSGLRLR